MLFPLVCATWLTAVSAAPVTKVASVRLEDLVRYSDRVVVGRVERVADVERDPHRKRARRSRVDELGDALRFAELSVQSDLKGAGEPRVLFLAQSTWTCDVTSAEVGEEVVLFLNADEGFESEGPSFSERLRASFGSDEAYRVLWSGRGRLPLSDLDGETHALAMRDVKLPDSLESLPVEPEHETSKRPQNRWVRLNDLTQTVLRAVERQRSSVYLRAMSSREGQRGKYGLGWTLELKADRRARLDLEGKRGLVQTRKEFTLSAMEFLTLQEALWRVERPQWNLSIGGAGLDPDSGMRTLEYRTPDSRGTLRFFTLDMHNLKDEGYRAQVREAFQLWSSVRGLIDDPRCVDRRAEDAAFLERLTR